MPNNSTSIPTQQPAIVAGLATPPSLFDLAQKIREANNKAVGSARKALEYAAECGRLLIEAKKQFKHGHWGYWVSARAGVSHKTASNYMRIASNWQRVADFKGSIRDTIKLLSIMDSPPKAEDTPQPDPAPPFKAKLIAPVTVEAEIVEPSPHHDEPEPDALVVDGTKPEALTNDESKRLAVLETQVDEGIAALCNNGMALPTILSLLPHLSNDELSKLMAATVSLWETLNGATSAPE